MFVTKCCNKNYQHKFDEKLNDRFLIHTIFLTTARISLFYCCKKVFFIMNIWTIEKHFIKHYLKKNIFTVT